MSAIPQHLQTALADRYTLERELGRGGMATVFLAQDSKHDRVVALKVLHPELAAALGPDRFRREIKMAARLNHPHILPLFDSGEASGWLYYVMPYVDGESLRERLDREKKVPYAEAVQLVTAIGSALDYAHRQNIVHRDIKPENVMLYEGRGRRERVFHRRYRRRDHQRPFQDPGAAGDVAHFVFRLQGEDGGHSRDRQQARSGDHPRGQRSQGGEQAPHSGPAHISGGRLPTLVGAVRPGAGGRFRDPGRHRAEHRESAARSTDRARA